MMYSFVTFGESWQMINYNRTFQMTEKMDVTFDTMEQDGGGWIKDYSVLVDCVEQRSSFPGDLFGVTNRQTRAS